jgi:DNA polymerase III epsilon subunit-like protein
MHLLSKPLDQCQFLILDLEATGGDPKKNTLTEIYVRRVLPGGAPSGESFHSLINPGQPIPPIVQRITGITDGMVRDAPPITPVMEKFFDFLKDDDILISHNIHSDLKFLAFYAKHLLGRPFPNFYLCTHMMGQRLCPEAPSKTLGGLAVYVGASKDRPTHRAQDDVDLTEFLWAALRERLPPGISLKEAILFQRDYLSSLKIGWALDPKNLGTLSRSPGVLSFFNAQGERVFFTSASDMRQEARRLTPGEDMARPLAKSLLQAVRVEAFPRGSLVEAMLWEGNQGGMVADGPLLPGDWHKRACYGLYWEEGSEGTLRGSLGYPTKKTLFGFSAPQDLKSLESGLSFLEKKSRQLICPLDKKDQLFSFLSRDLGLRSYLEIEGYVVARNYYYPVLHSTPLLSAKPIFLPGDKPPFSKATSERLQGYLKDLKREVIPPLRLTPQIRSFLWIYGRKGAFIPTQDLSL